MNDRDRSLGLGSKINRRDFIGGVGVALSGSLLACPWAETEQPGGSPVPDVAPRHSSAIDPPRRTGMRGNHPGSFEVAHGMRDGENWPDTGDHQTGESYDLVVVGGGLSGLSTAWFYRQERPNARILIIDNHDDFGGHAKRNEFWHEGRMLLSHGGTINISDFGEYGTHAQRLMKSLGVDVSRYKDFEDYTLYPSLGAREAFFFDRETFGQDRLVISEGDSSWRKFFSQAPFSTTAQQELAALFESDKDYLASMDLEEKRRYLRSISYKDFLIDTVGVTPEATQFFGNAGYWGIGIDALSAWAAVSSEYPGTTGLGFGEEYEEWERTYFQFPDGNASIARLLVRSLIPGVAPGDSMEDIVTAPFDYSRLDTGETHTRIRLESTVIQVRHLGSPDTAKEVEIRYVRDGQSERVRANHVVLACYNSVIPYICEEFPNSQKKALAQSLKAPLVYTNVLIRNWKAFQKLGAKYIRCPGSYFESINLNRAISMGDYSFPSSPDDPTVVRLFRIPTFPGLSAQDQWKAGRYELLSTPFETFEREIRQQMGRILAPGGFDPTRDIEAITVNRWPHGYAYGQDPETGEIAYVLDELPPERSPWLHGRKTFGRIAVANSDAAANAMTEAAIGEGHRAVSELLSLTPLHSRG